MKCENKDESPCRHNDYIDCYGQQTFGEVEVTELTAFKTISMRIRGAKTELEDAGLETEGMVESTAKLREEIMALSGVDIMENGQ